MHNLTGYGPRIITMDSQTIKWLVFNGKAENYPAWSTKFTAYMQTKGLCKALLGKEIIPEEIAPLAEDASNEQKTAWDAKVREGNKQIEEIKETTQYGVILLWHSTITACYTYDMTACHRMGTERNRGVYYNKDIQTSKSQR